MRRGGHPPCGRAPQGSAEGAAGEGGGGGPLCAGEGHRGGQRARWAKSKGGAGPPPCGRAPQGWAAGAVGEGGGRGTRSAGYCKWVSEGSGTRHHRCGGGTCCGREAARRGVRLRVRWPRAESSPCHLKAGSCAAAGPPSGCTTLLVMRRGGRSRVTRPHPIPNSTQIPPANTPNPPSHVARAQAPPAPPSPPTTTCDLFRCVWDLEIQSLFDYMKGG